MTTYLGPTPLLEKVAGRRRAVREGGRECNISKTKDRERVSISYMLWRLGEIKRDGS